MSGARDITSDVDIDIAGMLSSVWAKKYILLLLTLISGVLFFLTFSAISPRYESESRILIEKRESPFTRVEPEGFSGVSQFDAETVGSQVQILNSNDLAIAVIKETKLLDSDEFKHEPGILDTLRAFIPFGKSDSSEPSLTPEERVLEEFHKRLSSYTATGSRVLVIEFWAKNRKLAKDVVNTMAEKYIEFNRSAKLESTTDATAWLEPEIEDLRKKVLAAEQKVEEFRAGSDILVGQNNALLATQQLSEVSSELSRVRAERSSADAKLQSIKSTLESGGSLDVIPEVISSPFIQRMRERQLALQGEISQLATTLLPNHPRIKALRSQLQGFENQIRNAAQDILKSLENNVGQARKQEDVLIQEVNRLKIESGRVSEAEVQLRALEREAVSQRELLQSYLTRFREAASRQSRDYNPVDARIISRGTEALQAYYPKIIPFTIVGMISVLLLSIVGLFTGQLLSGRAFKSVSPAQEYQPVPVRHAEIPATPTALPPSANPPAMARARQDMKIDDDIRLAAAPVAVAPSVANDEEAITVDVAVTALTGLRKAVIAVVSPGGDPGSSATWFIARKLAHSGFDTVVCDLTGSGVTSSHMLQTNYVPGLHDVLSAKATLREVLFQDTQGTAHVLAAGDLSSIDIGSNLNRLAQISLALQETYDYVIFDCGHIGSEGLAKIATRETVVIIPTANSDLETCKSLEQKLLASGYADAIAVNNDDMDGTLKKNSIAA